TFGAALLEVLILAVVLIWRGTRETGVIREPSGAGKKPETTAVAKPESAQITGGKPIDSSQGGTGEIAKGLRGQKSDGKAQRPEKKRTGTEVTSGAQTVDDKAVKPTDNTPNQVIEQARQDVRDGKARQDAGDYVVSDSRFARAEQRIAALLQRSPDNAD